MITSPKDYIINLFPDKTLVTEFIKKYHYSKSCPIAINKCFTLEHDGRIIGACVFAAPSRQTIDVPGYMSILELSRLFVLDETPKNTESYFVGKCLRWLQVNTNYEAIVSFADPTQGHQGIVYQATNFKLLSITVPNYHYEDPFGNRIHKRRVWDEAKRKHIKEKDEAAHQNLKLITELPKNKYVYYLKPKKQNNIIYGLIDPRTDELKYIGKTEQGVPRFKEHLKESSLKTGNKKNNWIKSLLKQDLLPEFYIFETLKRPEELFAAEEWWYEYFIGLGCTLLNETKCGAGTRGYKHKENTIETMKNKALVRDKTPYKVPHNARQSAIIGGIDHLSCSKCQEVKPLDRFSLLTRNNRKFYDCYCKLCRVSLNEGKYEKYYKKLCASDYKQSRIDAAKAGAAALWSKPESKERVSKARSKPIQGKSITTDEVLTFTSALEAKEYGFQNSNIGQAIKYGRPYKGYTWSFA